MTMEDDADRHGVAAILPRPEALVDGYMAVACRCGVRFSAATEDSRTRLFGWHMYRVALESVQAELGALSARL